MRRRAIGLLAAGALVAASGGTAYLWFAQPPQRDVAQLVIYSSGQREIFDAVFDAYRKRHPATHIRYVDLDGETIYQRASDEANADRPGADILLSTAMDLQVKFVNDGYALAYPTALGRALPPWARWRDEAFGIAFEPSVLVYNRRRMAGHAVPATRAELVDAIHRDPAFWRGQIGIYDLRHRGIGYLLTSQEARQVSDFGALMKAFGEAGARLETGSGTMLDQVARGDLTLGYNVLESNARRRIAAGAPLTIVYPYDFTLAALRTVVIPRNAAHPAEAKAFLDFLLSPAGQDVLRRRAGFDPIRESDPTEGTLSRQGVFHPIGLGPELLVYLDTYKRRRFLANWQSLVSRDGATTPEAAPRKP